MKKIEIIQTIQGFNYQLKCNDLLIGVYDYYEDLVRALQRCIENNEDITLIEDESWKKLPKRGDVNNVEVGKN